MLKFPKFGSAKGADELNLADPPPLGATVILMVEDEPAARSLFVYALRRAGYYVLEARNGAEALDVAAKAGRLDLVITDIVMPVMKGPELAVHLRKTHPDLNFIFVSGYLIAGDLGPNAYTLQKPFSRNDLLKIVVDLIGPPKPMAAE